MQRRRNQIRSNRSNGQRGIRNRPKLFRALLHPPQFKASIVCNYTFRFKATSALSAVSIQSNDVSNLIQMAATTTNSYSLLETFKIKSVSMWGPMASDLVPVTVSLEWSDNLTQLDTNRTLHSDTSMGSAQVASILCRPPKNSTAGMWQGTGSTSPVFILNGPINTVVDLNISFTIINNFNGDSAPLAITVAGATVGQVYFGRLDGPTTGLLVPVSGLST